MLVGIYLSRLSRSQASALSTQAARAVVFTNPDVLAPGALLNSVPNGFSGPDFTVVQGPLDYNFNFGALGGPTGTLSESIVQWGTGNAPI